MLVLAISFIVLVLGAVFIRRMKYLLDQVINITIKCLSFRKGKTTDAGPFDYYYYVSPMKRKEDSSFEIGDNYYSSVD